MFDFLSTPIELEGRVLVNHFKSAIQVSLDKKRAYQVIIDLWRDYGLIYSVRGAVKFKKPCDLLPREFSAFIISYQKLVAILLSEVKEIRKEEVHVISKQIAKSLLLSRHIKEEQGSWQIDRLKEAL